MAAAIVYVTMYVNMHYVEEALIDLPLLEVICGFLWLT